MMISYISNGLKKQKKIFMFWVIVRFFYTPVIIFVSKKNAFYRYQDIVGMDLGCYIGQKWNDEEVSGMLEWIPINDMLCAK